MPLACYSDHLAGADIYISHKFDSTYEVKLVVYRSCLGAGMGTVQTVSYSSVSCGENSSFTVVRDTIIEITLPCDTFTTACSGGTALGYEKHVYYGEVTLPDACNDWKFHWSLVARNLAITNVQTSTTLSLYVELFLNNLDAPDNDSPTFINDPVSFICKDQSIVYKHLANDVNGDSLVYSLITPRISALTTVTYVTPFSIDEPISSSPPFKFDSTNGSVSITPTAMENTIFAILVEEYRNGQFIGSTVRDIQLTVIQCGDQGNTIPIASGMDSTSNFYYSSCAQKPISFDIFSYDPDTGQVITMFWDSVITDAQFAVNNDYNPIGTFSWFPDVSAANSKFNTFKVSVQDNACPFNGSESYIFNIKISGLKADFTFVEACLGDTSQFINMSYTDTTNCSDLYNFTGDVEVEKWYWDFGDGATDTVQNPDHLYSAGGTYLVMLIAEWRNADGYSDTVYKNVTIIIDSMYQADIAALYICPNAATFKDNSTGNPTSWFWQFEDGSTSTEETISKFLPEDTNTVTLIVGYGKDSCVYDTVTKDFYRKDSGIEITVAEKGCLNQFVNFKIEFSGDEDMVDGIYFFFGDGQYAWYDSLKYEENYTYQTVGSYLIDISFYYNSFSCTELFSQTIEIGATTPFVNAGQDTQLCFRDSTIIGFQGLDTNSHFWTPTIGLSDSLSSSPMVIATSSNSYILSVKDTNNCISLDTVDITVLALPIINTSNDTSICDGDSIQINVATDGVSYLWTPAQNISNIIELNPKVYPSQTTSYKIQVTASNGCVNSDSIQITVDTIPVLIVSSDTSICIGDTIQLYAFGADNFRWLPAQWLTNDSIDIPLSQPQQTVSYTVTGFNQLCESIPKSVTIIVLDLPNIDAGKDILIEKGKSTQLNGTGGIVYNWFPDADLDNSNIADPFANPIDTTKYYLTGTDVLGCKNLDSVMVFVLPSPEGIVVPGGFSPNGDDNNDEFFAIVENVSTFKLLVFNRWGEKLFEATSPDDGWDGTHRGVPVNAGVYVYYVEAARLGDKLGMKIQKSGNVTLIR
ncbi:gliding motility-associated C-terminal domain-containing protein [Sphingobacteriaceae bacterium AH-315-L07]|nr:gliding motility-associated C-terminal domain-containing protein [Sphingobacteriaceae bacterium AH-315-L07]